MQWYRSFEHSWFVDKASGFQKDIYFCCIDYTQSLWLCGSQQTVENFQKRWEYQTTFPASWETCMQVKKQELELDMEQQTSSKFKKRIHQSCILSPCSFNISRIHKCQVEWSTSWNQDFQKKYQQPQICRCYHSNGRKRRGTKEPPDEGERRVWKSWLETQHSKNEDSWHQVPSLYGK